MKTPLNIKAVMRYHERCYECEAVLSGHELRRVCRARDRLTGDWVVLKGGISPSECWPEAVLQEASLLRRLRHPALLPVTGFVVLPDPMRLESAPFFAFRQPWVTGPSLREALQPLNFVEVKRWLIQALQLIAWLHAQGLTRLDLKPEHFVRVGPQWKLIDLDQVGQDDPFSWSQAHGSLRYLAPECFRGDDSGPAADLFSLGAILGEILCGQPPALEGDRRASLYEFLVQRPPPAFPEWVETSAPELTSLARRLLDPNPRTRPESARTLLCELTGTPDLLLPPPPLPEYDIYASQEPHPILAGPEPGLTSNLQRGGGVVVKAPSRAGRSFFLQHTLERLLLAGVPALLLPVSELPDNGALLERLCRWLTRLQQPAPPSDLQPIPASPSPTPMPAGPSMAVQVEYWLQRLSLSLGDEESSDPNTGGRVVLIDDPGRLDDVSQRVLSALLPSLTGTGLVLILAGQGAELFENPARGVRCVDLPVLTSDQARAWTEAVLGPGALPSAHALRQLQAQTQGFPGRVYEQLLRWAAQPGTTLDSRVFSEQPEASGLDFPLDAPPFEAFGESGDGRHSPIGTLSPSALRLAQVVALRGAPTDDLLLMDVLEQPTLEPERSSLVSDGWLQDAHQEENGQGLVVTHPARQRMLLALLPDADKTQLQVRIAESLEQRHLTHGSQASPMDIVHHFLSSEPRRALPHLPLAVSQSISRLELSRAIGLLDQWHTLLRPQDPQRAELMRRSGLLALELGRLEDAQDRLQRALHTSGLQLFAAREKALLARCTAGLGRVQMKRGALLAARTSLTQALNLAEEAGPSCPPQERVSWQQWLAWLWGATGLQDSEGLRQMERLLEEARPHLEPASSAWCDQQILLIELGLRQEKPAETLRPLMHDALSLAEQQPERSVELRALTCALLFSDRAGDHEQAQRVATRLQRLMHQCFDLEGEMRVCNNLGMLARNTGQFLSASQHFARAARLAERVGRTPLILRYEHERVDVLLRAERLERAALHLAETSRRLQQQPDVDPSSALAQALLEVRLQLLQGLRAPEGWSHTLASHLDARLEKLLIDAQNSELSYLRLEAIADRMQLALAGGQAQQALRLIAPELSVPAMPETALAWKRLHRLASQAHRLLEGVETGSLQSSSPLEPEALSALLETASLESSHAVLSRLENEASPAAPASTTLSADAPRSTRKAEARSRPILEAPEQWLERIIRVLEVADGEEKLAVRLAELAGEALGGRGRVYFFGEAEEVIPLAERQQDPVSHTLIQRVRATGEPYYCPDVRYDAFLSQARSLRDVKRPCILCQPIRPQPGLTLGVVYVDELEAGMAEDPSALRVMTRVAGLAETLLEAFARRRHQVEHLEDSLGWLGNSHGMRKVARQVQLFANSDAEGLRILLLGETGVGKNVIAKAIHDRSHWSHHPFVSVNCPAIPPGLFESELFGHRKGAFTGAMNDRAGYCEQAGEGTLFLDEFGDLPMEQQSKLLSVLSQGEFRRVGDNGTRPIPFRARLICATNLPLERMGREGRFRADLLNRLAMNVCRIPALRERGPDDLRLLICRLLRELLESGSGKSTHVLPRFEDHFTLAAQQALLTHAWPGNVRDLKNLLWSESIRQRLKGHRKVDVSLIQERLEQGIMAMPAAPGPSFARIVVPLLRFEDVKSEIEGWLGLYVRAAVEALGGDKNAAAGALKCSRDTIYRYLNLMEETSTLSFLPCPELQTTAAETRHAKT